MSTFSREPSVLPASQAALRVGSLSEHQSRSETCSSLSLLRSNKCVVCLPFKSFGQAWWLMLVILVFKRLRQEDC